MPVNEYDVYAAFNLTLYHNFPILLTRSAAAAAAAFGSTGCTSPGLPPLGVAKVVGHPNYQPLHRFFVKPKNNFLIRRRHSEISFSS